MVAKGLDFDVISLVGVMQVDKLLHMPDFRANERCFQLVTQVAGRAGRSKTAGTAIIQTADSQPILQNIVQADYGAMYAREIGERTQYKYPPFVTAYKNNPRSQRHKLCTVCFATTCKKSTSK